MLRLAKQWETTADNLAIAAEPAGEIGTLLSCAAELRSTLEAGRPGVQSTGSGPAPAKVDPLGRVVVGDPDSTPDSPGRLCSQPRNLVDLGPVWCTRLPHPDRWLHIAGDGDQILAVWSEDAD